MPKHTACSRFPGIQLAGPALAQNEMPRNQLANGLDAIDSKILNALQRDGRLSNVDLARQVNLSPSPCLTRVKALEQRGLISG